MNVKKTKYAWVSVSLVFAGALALGILIAGPRNVLMNTFLLISEDTEYAPGYSLKAFRSLEVGLSEAQTRAALGDPLEQRSVEAYTQWLYSPDPNLKYNASGIVDAVNPSYTEFRFDAEGLLTDIIGAIAINGTNNGLGGSFRLMVGPGVNTLSIPAEEIEALKGKASPTSAVRERFGAPQSIFESRVTHWLLYSRSPSGGNYRQRAVGIDADGNICAINDEIYWD